MGAQARAAVIAAVVAAVLAVLVTAGVGSAAQPGGSAPSAAPAGGPSDVTDMPVTGTPCTAAARACVDLDDGLAWLLDRGVVARGPVVVMTGDGHDPTPRGVFHVQWKAEQYTSRQYLTQMPFSVFFANGGIAFHQGRQDTYSGGCVKLTHDDAMAWFDFLQVGDEVQIH